MIDNQQEIIKNKSIIFLVGFMGAGKTSIGQELAKAINYEFLDSDLEIERIQHLNVKQIFEEKGEKPFRMMEFQFIESIKNHKNIVISTGGGLPCNNGLMEELLKTGFVIYLNVPIPILVERLRNDTNRPLIQNMNNDELTLFIEEKLKERSIFYLKANKIIEANKPIDKIIQEIKWTSTSRNQQP